MKWLWGAARRPLRWARRLVLALLLPLLLLAALGQWWLLPNLNHYRDGLANALSDALHMPAQIDAVSAERVGWRLGFRLRGVRLRDPKTGAVLASFKRAAVTLNLWRSVREWRPAFGHIRLEGVNLTLEQGADGIPQLHADADVPETHAPALPDVARWLFDTGRLDIVGDQLTLRRRDGVSVPILHPYFQVRDTQYGQRLRFSAALPPELGDHVQLTIERPRTDPQSWQGTFEFRADHLHLSRWPSLLGWQLPLSAMVATEQIPRGEILAALELRGDWRDWQPTRIEGRLRLSGVAPNPSLPVANPKRVQLSSPASFPQWKISSEWELDGQRQETGWQLQGHARFTDSKDHVVAQSPFTVHQTGELWQGHIHDLRAQDLAAWTALWLDNPAQQWLATLNPQGNLPEIAIRIDPATSAYAATVQIRDVTFQPVQGLPGLSPLTGTLEFTPHQSHITLDSRKVRINTAGLLRAPITLDTLAGTVNWVPTADGFRVESAGLELANADCKARIEGSATVADTGPLTLDLHGTLHDVAVGQIPRYLPTLLPSNGLAWLNRALVGGQAAGDWVFRGALAHFPFDHDQGLFETRLQVENAILDYAPGWPRLEKLQAIVTFHNRGLRIETDRGSLLDAGAEHITAWIDDLNHTIVRVQGHIKGPGATLWQALKDSPVGRELGDDLPNLRISGTNTLDLDLTIPLPANTHANRIKGQVGLLENNMTLPGWNLELSRLRGEVHFTEADLDAKDVQMLLRDEPTRLDLDLIGRENRRALRTRLRGQWGLRMLAGAQTAALERYISGKSAWEAVLMVPTGRRERRGETPPFTLDLSSELRGTAIRLPAPLGKSASEIRPIRINLRPREHTALDITLDYGEKIRAALQLTDFSRNPQLVRGELRINAGTAKLPDAPGLAVIAQLPRWELTAFPTRSSPLSLREEKAFTDDPNPWHTLRSLDARIGTLLIGRQTFSEVSLNATRQEDGMRVELDGDTLAGRVIVPDQPSPEQPIRATLRRLYLHQALDSSPSIPKHADASTFDPRQLPPLLLTATDVQLNDAELGQLRLVTLPRPDGLHIAEFSLDSKQQRIDAIGDWKWTTDGQASRMQATLHSRALGETFTAFGYAETGIARGETAAELAVAWAAALPDFALDRLEGTLKLQIGPGQLLDVDPGVGRMVGVFNVQNLMRRLSLDFSDLFQSGMGFDHISGTFTFKQGQAYTDNLTIEAPAARIQIQGRAGLKERDYAQRITVTPKLGGALPIAGAIAGGPAVGAAVLLAERLLQKGIEQATRYQYALTGSWDRPVMKLMQEPHSPATPKGSVGDR